MVGDFADDSDDSQRHTTISVKEFEVQLCEELIVPPHLLKVTYTFEKHPENELLFPIGGTTRKRQSFL